MRSFAYEIQKNMTFTKACFAFLLTTIIMCCVHHVISIDCSPSSGNIKCSCDALIIECVGTQTNILEIQEILVNSSAMENVILKVTGLRFNPDFKFENMGFKNLTLGYGLETPSPDFLSGLSVSLISLNLQNNSIQNINDQLFASVKNLRELYLDINEISDLKSSMFINLKNLEYLSITSNDFVNVNPDVFEHLPLLRTLVLSHNNISLMENMQIKSSTLVTLKIDGCVIQGPLEKETFSDLPHLEDLDISYNKLSEVSSNSLSSLKNLLFLNLSYNVIECLRDNAFSELRNLTILDLKNNNLSVIAGTAFTNLLHLKFLDLSGNKLKTVLCDYTTDFISLERIYLQNNEIISFTRGAFFNSRYLKELNLLGNDLECSCELSESANYLLENSSMRYEDFSSVLCIIPTTLTKVIIIEYKSSKCLSQEYFKKIICNFSGINNHYGNTTNMSDAHIISRLPISSTDHPNYLDFTAPRTPIESLMSLHLTVTPTPYGATENSTLFTKDALISLVYTTGKKYIQALNSSHPLAITTSSSIMENSTLFTNSRTMGFNNISALSLTNNTAGDIYYINLLNPFLNMTISQVALVRKRSVNLNSTNACSSLDLHLGDTSADSELVIIKNFSYDGNVFCLKWTFGNTSSVKTRCIIKYTYIKGTKSQNLECPTSKNDIKIWSTEENIYKFCLVIYSDKKTESCSKVSEQPTQEYPSLETVKTSSIPSTSVITDELPLETITSAQTAVYTSSVNYAESIVTGNKNYTELIITGNKHYSESIIANKVSSKRTSTLSYENSYETSAESLTVVPIIHSLDFNVTSLLVFVNDSGTAYVKWVVNMEEPLRICNLTLLATTQYFIHQEGIFPCKNNVVRLESAKDGDVLKICLITFHKLAGINNVCKNSLSDISVDAEAPEVKKNSFINTCMIPLICSVISLILLIIFIILCIKKSKTCRQCDRADERKSESARIISPTYEQSPVRYSNLEKQNEDF